jgi:DUF4097 and DUF4098 domain-containing protein YvlB
MSTYLYRRGSIFWALTLIAVGGLFLYQNFNPNVRPWEILAKFWPIVIIFWGLSKLIDYFQSRAHPGMAPPPLFSASEVILLILVLITGTLVSRIVLHQWPARWVGAVHGGNEEWENLFQNSYTYTQSVSVPTESQPHLLLVNHRGDIEIRGRSQSSFEAVIKEVVHAGSEQEAKRLADQIKFQIAQQGGEYVLQSNLDSLAGGGRNVRLDITLSVPAATSTGLTLENGDLVLDGLKGDQNLTVNHGDAHVSRVEGLVRLRKSGGDTVMSNVKGDVEVEGRGGDVQISGATSATVNGEFTGGVEFSNVGQTLRYLSSRTDLTAQNVSGRLTMDSGDLDASGVNGPFELATRAKDINVDGFGHSVKISNTNGDIQLRAASAPTHPIEVRSAKGDIELALPATSSFEISASSHHGEVACDFSGPDLKVNNSGEERSITGSYGKGGPAIHISTDYGTIHLSHAGPSAPPTPPAPPAPPPSRT